jgi:hypothetical protein
METVMRARRISACVTTAAGAAILLTIGVGASSPASALTLKECSAKYKEAQAAGGTNGLGWNDFRKAECAAKGDRAPKAAASDPQAASGPAVFPSEISPKYASEKPGIARLRTCSDQFAANKAVNANGGLRWIQKGGGYWSECSKHLKG